MIKNLIAVSSIVMIILLSSCASDNNNSNKEDGSQDTLTNQQDSSIFSNGTDTADKPLMVEMLVEKGNYKTFLSAVQKAGISNYFFDEKVHTFFIPDDNIFPNFEYKYPDLTNEQLKNILLNHIVEGKYTEEQLLSGMELKALSGLSFRVGPYGSRGAILSGMKEPTVLYEFIGEAKNGNAFLIMGTIEK